jgi:hypothetical protein
MRGILLAVGIILAAATSSGFTWHLSTRNQGRPLRYLHLQENASGKARAAYWTGFVISLLLVNIGMGPQAPFLPDYLLWMLLWLAAFLIPQELIRHLHNRRIKTQSAT